MLWHFIHIRDIRFFIYVYDKNITRMAQGDKALFIQQDIIT